MPSQKEANLPITICQGRAVKPRGCKLQRFWGNISCTMKTFKLSGKECSQHGQGVVQAKDGSRSRSATPLLEKNRDLRVGTVQRADDVDEPWWTHEFVYYILLHNMLYINHKCFMSDALWATSLLSCWGYLSSEVSIDVPRILSSCRMELCVPQASSFFHTPIGWKRRLKSVQGYDCCSSHSLFHAQFDHLI